MGTYFRRLAKRSALAPAVSSRSDDASLPLEQETEVPAPPADAPPAEQGLAVPEVHREPVGRSVAALRTEAAPASGALPDRSTTKPPRPHATPVAAAPSIAPATPSRSGKETDAMAMDPGPGDSRRSRVGGQPDLPMPSPVGEPDVRPAFPGETMSPGDRSPSARAAPAGESAPATGRAPATAPAQAPAPETAAESAQQPATARFPVEAKPGRALPGPAERTEAAAPPVPEAPRQPRAVEVRIGSVTVEIHQAPAPLLPALDPPAPRRERVAAFSASRHYLRGD